MPRPRRPQRARRAHRADDPYRTAPTLPLQDQRLTILIATPVISHGQGHVTREILVLDPKGHLLHRTARRGSLSELRTVTRAMARGLILEQGASRVDVRYGGALARLGAWTKVDMLRGKLLRRYTADEVKQAAEAAARLSG